LKTDAALLMTGLLRLSRWKEHLLFTVPVTLLGVNMAIQHTAASLDWRVPVILAANILAVTCAFMVNDVEDALDDARDPNRAIRNPVACGEISRGAGWLAGIMVSLAALALYAGVGRGVWGIGAAIVALAYLYSWRVVRLKARPIVDILSHVLMLSSLLFLAGYFAYDTSPRNSWLVALGVGLVSAYGQLYNQLRDYDIDRAAKLRNTGSFLGPQNVQRGMYACIGLAVLCLALTVIMGLWPLWLIGIPILMAPVIFLFRPSTDMRGSPAVDASGRIQLGLIVMANVVTLVWLAVNRIGL
jgi:4-hydroxybenzoate polyprenyltransferase